MTDVKRADSGEPAHRRGQWHLDVGIKRDRRTGEFARAVTQHASPPCCRAGEHGSRQPGKIIDMQLALVSEPSQQWCLRLDEQARQLFCSTKGRAEVPAQHAGHRGIVR